MSLGTAAYRTPATLTKPGKCSCGAALARGEQHVWGFDCLGAIRELIEEKIAPAPPPPGRVTIDPRITLSKHEGHGDTLVRGCAYCYGYTPRGEALWVWLTTLAEDDLLTAMNRTNWRFAEKVTDEQVARALVRVLLEVERESPS